MKKIIVNTLICGGVMCFFAFLLILVLVLAMPSQYSDPNNPHYHLNKTGHWYVTDEGNEQSEKTAALSLVETD